MYEDTPQEGFGPKEEQRPVTAVQWLREFADILEQSNGAEFEERTESDPHAREIRRIAHYMSDLEQMARDQRRMLEEASSIFLSDTLRSSKGQSNLNDAIRYMDEMKRKDV